MHLCSVVSCEQPVPYLEALVWQQDIHAAVTAGRTSETLIVLEHPPTITLGRGSAPTDLLRTEDDLRAAGILVVEVDRGGEITYHAPGQLVGYPILDLARHGQDLHAYLRGVEEALIRALARFEIESERVAGRTGVWTGGNKIAAIGIKARRWVTMHGFALNIDNDLTPFTRDIVPCGIRDRGVTSVTLELAARGLPPIRRPEVEAAVVAEFCTVFDLDPIRTSITALRSVSTPAAS
ncbi:MAG: lipoyl(octanoyl) transferase LipB [Capsulimonadaceae bacterium]